MGNIRTYGWIQSVHVNFGLSLYLKIYTGMTSQTPMEYH